MGFLPRFWQLVQPCYFAWDVPCWTAHSSSVRHTILRLTDRAVLSVIAQIIAGIVAAAMADALLPGKLLADTKIGGSSSALSYLINRGY